jgi:HNH endonuclease
LWGRTRARCSFKGCQSELIQFDESRTSGAIIGEEAHIVAQKKDGARGQIAIDTERVNLYENLILLCSTHHTLIDALPTTYTV